MKKVDPLCQYFGSCGGCQLQHLSYDDQLILKKELVLSALQKKNIDFDLPDVIPSATIWNYRSRITLHKNREGKWGFFKTRSHEVIEIGNCVIAKKEINEQIKKLKPNKKIDSLELRADHSIGFIQSNSAQNQVLQKLVLNFLDPQPNDEVFDLYCGSGNYTYLISEKVKKVWGLERDANAIQSAIKNNQQSNVRLMQGEVGKLLTQLKQEGLTPNKLVINPPRAGLEKAIRSLLLFDANKIVYVSCNPNTFAHDAASIIRSGYHLTFCQPVDMFPQTEHVELVACFQK